MSNTLDSEKSIYKKEGETKYQAADWADKANIKIEGSKNYWICPVRGQKPWQRKHTEPITTRRNIWR